MGATSGHCPGRSTRNELDWSPNGRMIVFSGGTGQPGYSGLWTVNVSNGHLTRLIWGTSSNDAPAWSPDATRIAFGSNRDGTEQIWTLRLRITGSRS